MIVFKFAMRTEDGTRMFRAVVDGQVCISPEWMFNPFREAAPCWQHVVSCTCSCPIGTEHSIYCPAYGN